MSRLITEPNSCIRSVISLRDAPAPAQRASSKLWEKTGWSRRKDRGQIVLSPFLFQEKSLISATLSSEAYHLSLRGNACVNELFFFQRKLFSSSFSSDSRDCISPLLHSSFLPSFLLTCFHLYTSVEPLGCLRFFFSFLCFATSMYKKKFLSHPLKFARTFVHVKIKLFSLLTGKKDGTFGLK